MSCRPRGWSLLALGAGLLIFTLGLASCQATADTRRGVSTQGQSEGETALIASGTIEVEEVRIASELGGRVAKVMVAQGDVVRPGDLLVVLDATQVRDKLAEAEAEVATAQADLALIMAKPRTEEVQAARANLALAEAQRDMARAAWQSTQQAVDDPQQLDAQIADARTKIDLAEQAVELAKAQLAREQLLREQKADGSLERQIADLQVKAKEEALAAAEAEQQAARALLNQLWAIRNEPLALVAKMHLAEGQYQVAQKGVDVAREKLDDLLDGPTPGEIAVAQAAVTLAEAKADILRGQLAKFELRSPGSGVVLDLTAHGGEVVAPAATILTIADLSQVTLVLFVPANQIGQVALGQAVDVTVDSFPERAFHGRVIRIGNEPEFTPRNVATQEERNNTFFKVRVSIPNLKGLLKPGMPADAVFQNSNSAQ